MLILLLFDLMEMHYFHNGILLLRMLMLLFTTIVIMKFYNA